MIGEPGADKILALTGTARLVPLDSNALRVVQRLGLAPRTVAACAEAGLLLRVHGQELCKRAAPRCGECALNASCPSRSGGKRRT